MRLKSSILVHGAEAYQKDLSKFSVEEYIDSGLFPNRTKSALQSTFFRIDPEKWSGEEQSDFKRVVNDKQGGDWGSLPTSTAVK